MTKEAPLSAVPSIYRYPKGEFPLLYKTTLGERGSRLPTGIMLNGLRIQNFTLREFKFREEKLLTEIREKKKGLTQAGFVTEVLCLMLDRLGDQSVQALNQAEKRMLLAPDPLTDILFMYVCLRRETLGPNFPMRLACPNCRRTSDIETNLDDLDVVVLDDTAVSSDYCWYVPLRGGLAFRGQSVEGFWLRPLRWAIMESGIEADLTAGARGSAFVRSCIADTEPAWTQGALSLIESELDELHKLDFEELATSIEENSPGIKLTVEADCASCGFSLMQTLDWSYDSFFRLSRPSRVRTKS